MPQNRDWLKLDPDERIRWADHPSRWIVWPKVLAGVALLLFAIRFSQQIPFSAAKIGPFRLDLLIILIAAVAGALPAAYAELVRRTTMYVITSKMVWYKKGIISRDKVDYTELIKVADQEYNQSIFDRLVGKAQFDIMTKGTGDVDMRFWDVPNPNTVKDSLQAAREQARKRAHASKQEYSQTRQQTPQHQRDPIAEGGQPTEQSRQQPTGQSQAQSDGSGQHPHDGQPSQSSGARGGERGGQQNHDDLSRYSDKETKETDSIHHPASEEDSDTGPHYVE